jgi:hypothetical protein
LAPAIGLAVLAVSVNLFTDSLARAASARHHGGGFPADDGAIVDRLTFAGEVIETGTTSYRLSRARAAREK